MSLNLTEINQKVLRTVKMGTDLFRKAYDLHYNPTPKDVPFDYPDANGNLTTTQMPNMAKFRHQVWDDVGGALGQFSPTYYVDHANGDDNNSGSSSAPFKTIKKAVDSAPAMSVITIVLKGTGHVVDANILGRFSKVEIYGDTTVAGGKSKIIFKAYTSNNYNFLYGFDQTTSVSFLNCEIDFDLSGDNGSYPYSAERNVVRYSKQRATVVGIHLYKTKVNLPNNDKYRLAVATSSSQAGIALSMYLTEIHSASANNMLVKIGGATLTLVAYSTTYTGEITTLEPLIAGIVKDGNGVPRNVLSNVVI